ncbi:MAG: C40 family peptidase [Actinomycetota bacterium]|nr:C40 family peptidase [Actinomycetota bacterium]
MTTKTSVRVLRRVTIAAAILLMGALGGPAGAHSLDDYQQERVHIKDRARSVVGAPYSYGGTSPSGFDCSGFTRWVYSGHGAELPRTSLQQFELGSRAGYERIWERSKLQPGDLVFHKTTSARVGHVGIYIGNDRFISTTSSSGVQVRSIYDPYYWGPRWVGATRLPATMRDAGDGESGTEGNRATLLRLQATF